LSDKSLALRMAGSVRRRVYPEVDRLRQEVATLRAQVKTNERETKARIKSEVDAVKLAAKEAADRRWVAQADDVDQQTLDILAQAKPYTMTSRDKGIALVFAARHIARVGIRGAIVECGVWRGGSVHIVARVLDAEGVDDRDIHLFDTFEGMTEPTDKDVQIKDGRTAAEILETSTKNRWIWAIASLEDVQEGLRTLPYPYERFVFVQGPVEETIPEHAPEQIALLRLDTDWYESTKHEFEHLYERLVPGGILIVDDYGSWAGSKLATDEFMATLDNPPFMLRAGRSRIGVKP
jgi:O-methyltransferase